jgi:superfamily II DNA or RNA helicase
MEPDVRDKKQQIVCNKYLVEDPLKCTLLLSTGFGKSKVVIDIIKAKKPNKVRILVNSTQLRDESWEVEFKKFGMEEFYKNNVEMHTYQVAYKWTKATTDLSDTFIVADEVDFAADVPEFSKFFYEYADCKILGVTGFITESKKLWFKDHLPVFYSYSADEAQQDKLLNNIKYVFVKYDLSRNPDDVEVGYKKGGVSKTFKQSENSAYLYAQKKFILAMAKKSKLLTEYNTGSIDTEDFYRQVKSIDYEIRMTSNKRSDLLLNSVATAAMARKLITHITKDENNKVIVFSKRTEQSAKVCGADKTYNGKTPKKDLKKRIDDFNDGTTRVLGVCDKINRGANLEGLNNAILETFFGSDTKLTQRAGRGMRLKPDEVATFYVLLPYSITPKSDGTYVSRETQQITWARSMLRSTNVVLHKVWDYRTIKNEK